MENKYLQMKVALERMSDIKSVLNRFFANEDLFDEKMDLKEQKVQMPVQETEGSPFKNDRVPSRENRNITKLKPLNNSRKKDQSGEEEDFWKGDFSTKNHRNF